MGSSYLARRAATALFTIGLIVLINFLLFRAMPGSPERVILRGTPNITQERLAAVRERWGLNDPVFPDQFVAFVGATVQGDLGYSFIARGQAVTDVLAQRIWPTVLLFGLGEVLAIVIGLGLGAYSGWRKGGPVDYVGNGVSLILYSTPYFLLGMVLLLIFATGLRWFPTFGMLTAGANYPGLFERLVDFVAHLTLPLLTVALGLVGQYAIVPAKGVVEYR